MLKSCISNHMCSHDNQFLNDMSAKIFLNFLILQILQVFFCQFLLLLIQTGPFAAQAPPNIPKYQPSGRQNI